MYQGSAIEIISENQSRQSILLVEDDVYVAKYIRKRLVLEGFDVTQVSNGVEALETLSGAVLPDLIISDLRMPKLDGMELLERLRKLDRTATMPIIILSGSATVQDRIASLDRGASDYLSKPIDGAELAARVRVHLRHTSELRRLRREARFDPLTGTLNRRGALEAIQRASDRCRRASEPLTIMLIDADKFKDINDTFGHNAGDVVLIEIAEALRECLRLTDVVGRMGGDEFVIALPGVDEALATQIKGRLSKRVSENMIPGSSISVEISIGRITDSRAQYSLAQLFDMADRAMYADKASRRRTLRSVTAVIPAVDEPAPDEQAAEAPAPQS